MGLSKTLFHEENVQIIVNDYITESSDATSGQ